MNMVRVWEIENFVTMVNNAQIAWIQCRIKINLIISSIRGRLVN